MAKWVTFRSDEDGMHDLMVHPNYKAATEYFQKGYNEYHPGTQVQVNLPMTYGDKTCSYTGMSKNAFEKEYMCKIQDA